MKRPDLDTLACVNAECQLFRHAGAHNLVIRKVYGHDRIRLLRCRTCGEEFSERFHDQRVYDLTPKALEFDEQWSFVKKSRSVVGWRSALRRGTCRTIRR